MGKIGGEAARGNKQREVIKNKLFGRRNYIEYDFSPLLRKLSCNVYAAVVTHFRQTNSVGKTEEKPKKNI
jgi:hypothetical protein